MSWTAGREVEPRTSTMSLAVTERKESADAVLERVIEMRPGWLKMDYQHRGPELQSLNVVQYVDKIGFPSPKDPSEAPLTNYRCTPHRSPRPKFAAGS